MLTLTILQAAGMEPKLQIDVRALNPEPYTVTLLPPERGPRLGSNNKTSAEDATEKNIERKTTNLQNTTALTIV